MVWFDPAVAPGWLDWVGILLALAGFWYTIKQVMKTREASEAATEAATAAYKHARNTMVSNSLLSLSGQFQLVVADLDHAIDTKQSDMARRALIRYAHLARETAVLLVEQVTDSVGLADRLRASTEATLDLKEKLVQQETPNIPRLSKLVSREVNDISAEMTRVVSELRHTPAGATDV